MSRPTATSAPSDLHEEDVPDDVDDDLGGDDLDTDLEAPRRTVSDRALGVFLLVGGGIGLAAASMLTYDKFSLLENPQSALSCDYSAFVSCSGVMTQWQAELFGFPNSFIGMVAFGVVVTLGVVVLSGSRLATFVWGGLQAGVVLGMAFVVWLMSQSIFVIGTLCPYCMVVWAVMIPTFWYVTRRNLVAVSHGRPRGVAKVVVDYHAVLVFVSYAAVATTILLVFGDRLWA